MPPKALTEEKSFLMFVFKRGDLSLFDAYNVIGLF